LGSGRAAAAAMCALSFCIMGETVSDFIRGPRLGVK
jgi:hypothetical protein